MRQHSGAPEPKWNRWITRRIFPPDSEKSWLTKQCFSLVEGWSWHARLPRILPAASVHLSCVLQETNVLKTAHLLIERLHLTSQAAKHLQHSVLFRFTHKTARQESSTFYSDLRNASSLALTKYYCINFRCSAATMPIKLSNYVTWSTSETVASVQLPLNAVFFCLAEVVSHVILWRHAAALRMTSRSQLRIRRSNLDRKPWNAGNSNPYNIMEFCKVIFDTW